MTENEDSISRMYNEYLQAFQTLQARSILPYYHVPCLMISSQEVVALTTSAEIEAYFAHIMERLKARNYGRTDIKEFRVNRMSEGIALLSIDLIRYKTDGEKLARLGFTYTLRKKEGWKVAAVMANDLEKILRLA
jgi:ketosteroid isomerase-like protein